MDALLRRRIMMMELGGTPTPPTPLPYDAEVEYLEGDGNSYIDTGIIVTNTDAINAVVMFLSKSGDNMLFGSASSNVGIWVEIYANNTWYVRFGSTSSSSHTAYANVNNIKRIKLSIDGFFVNNNYIFRPNYSSMPNQTLALFSNATRTNYMKGRIYSFSITNGDNYRLDFIPVRVGTVGYMYDRVSGQLFGNQGTGDFILGNDKNT